MLRSNAGAARVSIMWIITAGVLFLAAVAFAFVASSDLAKERVAKVNAQGAKTTAENLAIESANEASNVSVVLGWIDEDTASPRSNLELAQEEFANLREIFTDLTDQDDRVDEILPKLRAAYEARRREITTHQTRIQELENELRVRDTTIATITSEKDARITALQNQLADEVQTAATRNEELERRLAAAQQQFSDRDQDYRRSQNDSANLSRQHDRSVLEKEARINELSTQLRFKKPPYNGYPDGKILSTSDKLPLAWIDIGSNERVVQGLRFRVESGTSGDRRVKGWAEVTRVESGMAEVVLSNIADEFDPVVAGDVLLNPVFDPKGGRNAILVGRFSGQFSKKELAQMLEGMGVRVQDELDNTTTFMIVGSPLFSDPDTGEPLEDPMEPSDLPVYKDAEAISVQVVPLAEIREYFRTDVRTSQR